MVVLSGHGAYFDENKVHGKAMNLVGFVQTVLKLVKGVKPIPKKQEYRVSLSKQAIEYIYIYIYIYMIN